MKQHACLYLLFAGLLLSLPAAAQRRKAKAVKKPTPASTKITASPKTTIQRAGSDDTTIRSTTLEVYQVYKPEIKPGPKPELTPTMPPVAVQRVAQTYEVPQQTLYYTYRSLPLKPLALGRDTSTPPSANYVKGGGGNLSTIYADLGIGSLKGRNWESAIHARHISQSSNMLAQRFWHTGLDATGTLHDNGHAFSGGLMADYHRFGLYGGNETNVPEEALRRNFFGAGVQFAVQNEGEGLLGLDYHPVVKAGIYTGTMIKGEQTIDINVPVSKRIDTTLTASFGVHGIFTHYKADTISEGNNIFQLTPGLSFQRNFFKGHLGLSPTFGKGGVAYLLPDVTAAYQLSTSFTLHAGWQAQLVQNTFQQLSAKNPFLSSLKQLQQSRTDEVFLAAATGIGPHFSLEARVSWWQYNNLPIFTTDTSFADRKTFALNYDPRVNAISLQAAARYQIGEMFSLGVSGAWYGFYNQRNDHVYHEPAVRLKADLQWQILRDLQVNAYASVLDKIYAQSESGPDTKLKGVLDIGLGAEYQLVPKLSLWLNMANLLDRKNERWLGYPAYGFNIFGGLRFRF